MSDHWAEWLRSRRDGGSVEQRRAALEFLRPIRDQILDSAKVGAGDVLLDVGCGDGLIGLGALDRGAQVIFSDVSQPCLDDCQAIAGDAAQYRLVSATDLGDMQVDVVTTRSVLIYVDDKAEAFAEFFRVLRPGGRLSIFEPINRFGLEERRATYGFHDVTGVEELIARVVAEADSAEQGAGGLGAMIDFDERDLISFGEKAGFDDIRLTLHAEITNEAKWRSTNWEVFLDSSPNPFSPTFREAMRTALQPVEEARLTAVIRPQIEAGSGTTRSAKAFLSARKPSG